MIPSRTAEKSSANASVEPANPSGTTTGSGSTPRSARTTTISAAPAARTIPSTRRPRGARPSTPDACRCTYAVAPRRAASRTTYSGAKLMGAKLTEA